MYSLNQFFNAINYALRATNYHSLFLKVKQYQILESIILKRDTIGVLPTGYGKSVIFHLLPFVADYLYNINVIRDNTTCGNIVLIVTPLNAIIDDQIAILKNHGIEGAVLKTVSINHVLQVRESDEDEDESDCQNTLSDLTLDPTTNKNIKEGKFKIIYSHPEAFISCKEGRRLLMSSALQRNVFACVIDEGHLVCEWGAEFRKDFAKLSQLGSFFPESPFLVLTATAPKHVQEALTSSLLLNKPKVVCANLDRPNIFIHKEKRLPASTGEESFKSVLLPIAIGLKNKLRQYPLTLIYLPLKWCGYAFKLFMDVIGEESYFPPSDRRPKNCLFAQFHAPQTQMMKDEILKQLQSSDESTSIRVVFATVAIGIGVNLSGIRHVVHISVPGTIESIYQEIGRAGRDGKPSKASIYYNGHDISLKKPGMTSAMRSFCSEEDKCLRGIILDYLGSALQSKKNILNHSCCSNCSKMCKSLSCKTVPDEHEEACDSDEEEALLARRHVSPAQRTKIKSLMQAYRLQLGRTGHHIGGIDTRTGVTLELIEAIASKCEFIESVESMFSKFEIWDIKHAQSFFKIINDVCQQ